LHRAPFILFILFVAGSLLVSALALSQARRPILRVNDIRPGMRGYGLTVFRGETPERFDVEVIDVLHKFRPDQDLILIRTPHPILDRAIAVGGMSGSPIYIDGKLVGALAYGYRFNKDPIGGITPMSNMFAVGDLPFRPDVLPHNKIRGTARPGAAGWADAMLGLDTTPLPPRRRPDDLTPQGGLAPLGAPMSVSGLGSAATRFLADTLGLVPARGGSGGTAVGDAKTAPAKTWQGGD
jgi:hypothetical protein